MEFSLSAPLELPSGHRIRPMGRDDLAAVHRLECSGQTHPWSLAQLTAELDNPFSSVDLYCCDDEPVGFVCSWLVAGELEIQDVVTAPHFRRQGVAARLVRSVLARALAAGMTAAWLEVRVGNQPAIALYERLGFQPCGRRAGYYADGEDALMMVYHAGQGPT